jgi:hypothetical protein
MKPSTQAEHWDKSLQILYILTCHLILLGKNNANSGTIIIYMQRELGISAHLLQQRIFWIAIFLANLRREVICYLLLLVVYREPSLAPFAAGNQYRDVTYALLLMMLATLPQKPNTLHIATMHISMDALNPIWHSPSRPPAWRCEPRRLRHPYGPSSSPCVHHPHPHGSSFLHRPYQLSRQYVAPL